MHTTRAQVSFLKNARNGSEPHFIGVSTKEGLMDASLLHPSAASEVGRNFRLQDIRMKDFLRHHDRGEVRLRPRLNVASARARSCPSHCALALCAQANATEWHYYSGPMAWWPAGKPPAL
jgi:hypothetical protein